MLTSESRCKGKKSFSFLRKVSVQYFFALNIFNFYEIGVSRPQITNLFNIKCLWKLTKKKRKSLKG